MHNAKERTKVIEHTKYDNAGNPIGTFNVTTTTNETDDAIYLTRELCERLIRESPDSATYFSWGNNTGKKAYYESGDTIVPITGYEYRQDGKYGVMTFKTPEGKTFVLDMSR